jgi:hypothetical protein
MTRIRLRYLTLKLRALCWVLRRLRAGQCGWSEIQKPLTGRAKCVMRPGQGQSQGLGGNQAGINKQYSGQSWRLAGGASAGHRSTPGTLRPRSRLVSQSNFGVDT